MQCNQKPRVFRLFDAQKTARRATELVNPNTAAAQSGLPFPLERIPPDGRSMDSGEATCIIEKSILSTPYTLKMTKYVCNQDFAAIIISISDLRGS